MTTRRHSIRFAAVGLAMSGLMALAACGGDDDDNGNDRATTTVEAPSQATDPAAGDDTDTTVGTDDTTATDDTVGDDTTETTIDVSDVDALSADECRALADEFRDLGFDATTDSFDDLDDAFAALEDAVPGDLKNDVRTMREGFQTLQEANEKYQDDPTNPEYLEALEAIGSPEYEQATARLSEYFSNCDDAVTDE